ncbi:NAD(P)-dependent oxidoreductase [Cytobacillus sp. NCCP-133]|uniref:NAD(P)-dependent oxidoreductase n=1 Tax=Cytobacillus sp. NCCP-133 TaxID=766848 RepID=UPI0022303E12|nr:NAD(P)-dependent oxidoreductase [Cytobacillus sp. NCCP-133]GLB60042.1 NAD(P)-binding protein [Cytobacillus sp. NCCP-133]
MQPLVIDLTGKKIVIAGGGKIAFRKANVLSSEGADITFIAPDFSKDVIGLANQKNYSLLHKEAQPSDFKDAFLSIMATNNREINSMLVQSLAPSQLVCVVDESGEGNVAFPATIRRGHLQIAVTSNGSSPKLTRMLKKELEEQFNDSWIEYTAFLSACREQIKKLPISYDEKNQLLAELLDDNYRLHEYEREKKWQYLQSLT